MTARRLTSSRLESVEATCMRCGWIAATRNGRRVHGLKHRRYMAVRLRYVLGIDATAPIPEGVRPDDAAWVNGIAAELAAPILEQREEPTWSR